MSTKIYWFSGTGNSLAVAKALHESMEDSELIPVTEGIRHSPKEAERIGLVFPVYGWGPPRLVERFVRRLILAPSTYIFSIVTYAGNQGDTLAILQSMLKTRHLDLAAGWGVKMPENYPPMGGPPAPDRQLEINGEASEKVAQIVEELKTSPRTTEQSAWIWRQLSKVVYPGFRRFLPRADRWFSADDKCNGCGTCADVCPVNDIVMENGKPKWTGHCEQCFACLHWCPEEAVQYIRSNGQPRYHHPDSELSDFKMSR